MSAPARSFTAGTKVTVYLGRGLVREATIVEHNAIHRRALVHYTIDEKRPRPDRADEWVSENQL